jgi:Ca2+/Na+ antiporter
VEAIWVPIAMFASLAIIVSFFFWFRYRSRSEMQQTIRAAIDKGQELTPDLVESLGQPQRPSKDKDLRYALVWFAVAIGFSALGGAIGAAEADEEVFLIMTGVAGFPFMMGLAYLVMWKFTERTQ